MPPPPADLLRQMSDAAIASAQPDVSIEFFWPEHPQGGVLEIGTCTASAVMARVPEQHWPGATGVFSPYGADGIAGVVTIPDTLERAWALGINPHTSLADNDGHGCCGTLDNAVVIGSSLTNGNDFRALLILP